MTLRSVDMQVLIPKVSEVNRNQPVQNQQDHISQQQFAEVMRKETEIQRQQVQNPKESESSKINQEAGGNKQGRPREERPRRDGKDSEEETAKDPTRGNLLDIKI